nr:unnamed protein product [Callosobruchus chinensis]
MLQNSAPPYVENLENVVEQSQHTEGLFGDPLSLEELDWAIKKSPSTAPGFDNADWEKIPEFQSWIRPSNQGITYFNCSACGKDYIVGIAAVKKHNIH